MAVIHFTGEAQVLFEVSQQSVKYLMYLSHCAHKRRTYVKVSEKFWILYSSRRSSTSNTNFIFIFIPRSDPRFLLQRFVKQFTKNNGFMTTPGNI